ncbi:PAS domain S-box protein [Aquiflexum sp. TKW24L]|uniref:PAS domain S-box protein n=1 Tax=Aquiflexum sp. TKW24L TaxID=2942212 RepID=UPI0020BEB312|nr:PAS domain S-box protein [Aquiflexum sp. TKW24L]MCL6260617.1 PAS domain S-box protein [Aquiflexum sp. TKW24L]
MEFPNVLKERLNELEAYHLIETDEITDFDSLTKIAAEICQTKIALVSFVAQDKQWIKSHHGIDLIETPLDTSFSVHVIQEPDRIFIIEDTSKDERFKGNPFVTAHPNISFYAAVSLVSPRGIPFGVLSVMDDKPKRLNEIQIHTLNVLANQIIQLLELRRMQWESEKKDIDNQGNQKGYQGVQHNPLRKSEKQRLKLIESVIMNTKDAVLITEAEPMNMPGPRIIFVNEAFTKMTGYEADEVIGKTPRILQGPKSNYAELAKLGEAMRKWEPYEITTINYKKNGDPFWINFTVTPVVDEWGHFTHWISIERDVTLQKNLELEKQLFSDISLFFNIDNQLKTCLEFVVKKLAEFGGFSLTEIWLPDFDKTKLKMMANFALDQSGKDFFDSSSDINELNVGEGLPGRVWQKGKIEIYHVSSVSEFFVRKDSATKSGINSLIGIPLSHNNETIGTIVIGVKNADSAFSFYFELFKNLQTFIGSEIQRKRLENELNQIFSSAPDIICLVDFEGRFRKMNMAGCALLGYTESEIYNIAYQNLVHEEDRNITSEIVRKLREGENVRNFENRYLTKSGDIIWLSWTCNSAFDEGLIYGVAKDVTKLKKLQMLLDDSSKLAKVGSWEIDVARNTVYWSDTTKEIREVEPDFSPTLSKGMSGFVEGHDQDTIRQRVRDCIQNGIPWDEELQIITHKGNLKWVRTIGRPVFENRKCVRVFGSFQDIHQLKVAEMNLKASLNSLENYKLALDQSAIIAFTDAFGVIISVNDNFCKISKYSKEEIIGQTHRFINSDFHPKEFFKDLWDTISSGKVWRGEIRNRAKDHTYYWVDTTIVPFIGEDNKPYQYLAIRFDITPRKITAEQIRLSNERFEKVSEATNDAIWDWDLESGDFYQGKGFEKLFGYKVGKVLRAVDIFQDKSHPDDIEGILSSLNAAIEDSKIKNWTHEYRIINEKTGIRSVIAKGMIIRNLDGKAIRMVGAITDITHQKEHEESLKNLNNELESKAKKLEFSNSELEQFAFIASHDLQEPLRMVTSFMSQLERKYGNQLDEKAHTYIGFAKDGATRMKGIIRDLLDYSRAGKVETEKEKIDLNLSLKDYVLLRKKLLADNGGSILFQSLPLVEAYKAPLEQTIYNLLDNALKYSKPSTSPVVRINVKDEGNYWLFSIQDNGLGISEEYFDQIFVIFQRLHNRDEYSGTGMGLAIVKKNVESWNGKIWLDSIKGTGTTFFFTLPK